MSRINYSDCVDAKCKADDGWGLGIKTKKEIIFSPLHLPPAILSFTSVADVGLGEDVLPLVWAPNGHRPVEGFLRGCHPHRIEHVACQQSQRLHRLFTPQESHETCQVIQDILFRSINLDPVMSFPENSLPHIIPQRHVLELVHSC